MEPLDPEFPDTLYRCSEDQSVPARLVGEKDAVALPSTEALTLECEGLRVGDGGVFSGGRARLTSHRFYCFAASLNAWVAVRLDKVRTVECVARLFRTKRCVLTLMCGRSIAIKRDDAMRTNELVDQFSAAIRARMWQASGYELAATGGLARVLARRDAKQQATGDTLDVALSDLSSLKEMAAKAVAVARQLAARSTDGAGEGQGVQELLREMGLVKEDGGVIATGGSTQDDVAADVERICEAVLVKRGGYGMLLVHDVFCLVNRARGTALVSPAEVIRGLRARSGSGGKLQLRALGATGALAVSLARSSDAKLDERLLELAQGGPLSAFALAPDLGVTSSEAQYLLRDAESRATLVRDEAPDGVFYYPNFFDDY